MVNISEEIILNITLGLVILLLAVPVGCVSATSAGSIQSELWVFVAALLT